MNNFWKRHNFPVAGDTDRDHDTMYPSPARNDSGYNHYRHHNEQYSTQSNAGQERPGCSSSQDWDSAEPSAEDDPDGYPYEPDEEEEEDLEDLELKRKRKELQVIEEQILFKKASLALKSVNVEIPKRRRFTEESKPFKERVEHILQTRSRVYRTNHCQATSRRSSFKVPCDHPLKLRVAAALERRFVKPPELPQKHETMPYLRTAPAPQPTETPPVTEEVNKNNQGFMRFLSILNQGVDITKLTEMANQNTHVMAQSSQNGAKSDCATDTVKPSVIVREKLRDENEPQKHLKHILDSLGLSFGKDEISQLDNRTQQRLYGKKLWTDEEVDASDEKTQTEQPQQQQERKNSTAHDKRSNSCSKSSSKSNKSLLKTPSPYKQQKRTRPSHSKARCSISPHRHRDSDSPHSRRDSHSHRSSKSISKSNKAQSRTPSPYRRRRRSRSPRYSKSSWSSSRTPSPYRLRQRSRSPRYSKSSWSPSRTPSPYRLRQRSRSPRYSKSSWSSSRTPSPYGPRQRYGSPRYSQSSRSPSRTPSPYRRQRRSRSPTYLQSSWSPVRSRHSNSPYRRKDSLSPPRRRRRRSSSSKSASPQKSSDQSNSHLKHIYPTPPCPTQPYPYQPWQYPAQHFPPQMNPGTYYYTQYTAYYNYQAYNQAPVQSPGPSNTLYPPSSNCIGQSNSQTHANVAPLKKKKTKAKNARNLSNLNNVRNPSNLKNLSNVKNPTNAQDLPSKSIGLSNPQTKAEVAPLTKKTKAKNASDVSNLNNVKNPTNVENPTNMPDPPSSNNIEQSNPQTNTEVAPQKKKTKAKNAGDIANLITVKNPTNAKIPTDVKNSINTLDPPSCNSNKQSNPLTKVEVAPQRKNKTKAKNASDIKNSINVNNPTNKKNPINDDNVSKLSDYKVLQKHWEMKFQKFVVRHGDVTELLETQSQKWRNKIRHIIHFKGIVAVTEGQNSSTHENPKAERKVKRLKDKLNHIVHCIEYCWRKTRAIKRRQQKQQTKQKKKNCKNQYRKPLTKIEDLETPVKVLNDEENEPKPMPVPAEEQIKANLMKKLEPINSRKTIKLLLMPQNPKKEDETEDCKSFDPVFDVSPIMP